MAEKTIGGTTYKVDAMLATRAIVLQARLMRLLGGAIERLPQILSATSPNASDEVRSAANAAAISALTDIFTQSDPEEVAALVKDVVEIAMRLAPSGSYIKVDFDGDFTGKLGDVIPLCVFVLREQFGDFFSAAKDSGRLN